MTLGLGIFLSTLLVVIFLLFRWGKKRWEPRNILKTLTIWMVYIIGVAVPAVLAIWGFDHYKNLPTKQMSYYGISIGMSKAEVRYAMGEPTLVEEPDKDPKMVGWMSFMKTSEIPAGKSIDDYDHWSYEYGTKRASLNVAFDSNSKKAKEISCDSRNTDEPCQAIFNISTGTSEEGVIEKLGRPSKEHIQNGIKTMIYSDLNLQLFLQKKVVFMLKVKSAIEQ